MKQKIIISAIVLIIIFLGIEFLPGFNFGKKISHTDTIEELLNSPNDITLTPNPTTSDPQTQAPTSAGISQPEEEQNVKNDQYTIKPNSLLGLDKSIESSHFTLYFHSEDEEQAKEVIAAAEKDYPKFSNFFKILAKTEILLTNDADEYIDIFNAAPPYGREIYKDSNFGGGSFCPGCTLSLGKDTEYVYMLRLEGGMSFAHELSHRYFWTNYPNLRKKNYNWINEGLAVYVQNEISPGPGGFSSNLNNLKNFILPANLIELEKLQQNPDSLERFYDLVGLLAIYISKKNNDYGLREFLTDLNNTEDIEKTCQNKFGFGLNQLLENWKTAIIQTLDETSVDFLNNFKEKI